MTYELDLNKALIKREKTRTKKKKERKEKRKERNKDVPNRVGSSNVI